MDGSGYWEPHSASVDFCEPNYILTKYVAEPHNTWSSALITLLAYVGYRYGNPTKERRFSIMYLILGSVGIGSMALHATLHWLPQSSDEVPMLWQTLTFIYALMVTNDDKKDSQRSRRYGYAFTVLVVIQTIVYYRFQHVYIIFVGSFMTYVAVIATWMMYLTYIDAVDIGHRPFRRKLLCASFVSFVILGASIWIADMKLCQQLLPYYLSIPTGGMTLHVLWHIFSCMGSYYSILFLIGVRLQVLKQEPQLEFVWGFIPVCRAVNIGALSVARKMKA